VIKIYPNPVSGSSLNLFLNTDLLADYEIIGFLGQLVAKGVVTEKIDVSNLKTGIHFLRITNANKVHSKRFIKR